MKLDSIECNFFIYLRVLALLKRTKLLSKTTFNYLTDHWESILDLILNKEISTIADSESRERSMKDEEEEKIIYNENL